MQRMLTLLALAAIAAVLGRVSPPASAAPAKRPNFLVIMTDDQSHDTLTAQFMPRTLSGIADEGVRFTQGFDTTALCCPSRSSFLTGEYARHHGVHDNRDRLTATTIAERLHDAGYRTGLVGKYLNSWSGEARPEFDDWAAWIGGYTDAKMNVRGTFETVPGYQTYALRDFALQFLRETPGDKPFFLLFTPHAPHTPSTPAPRDADLYRNLPRWRPPNFNPAEMPGVPSWLQERPPLSHRQVHTDVDELRRRQLACLRSVDEAVGDILDLLREERRLDDTFVVFYSDNGFFWGEHRLALEKNHVYEEAHHVPFAVRYPPLVASSRVDASFVANVDLAPTMCELAGIPVPDGMDGRSLVPLLSQNGAAWRDAMLLEGWPDSGGPYRALRTDGMLYAETAGDLPELYDLASDPYEMTNLAADPDHAADVETLRRRLLTGDY
jgi:arylsulfatase A-like enzyme